MKMSHLPKQLLGLSVMLSSGFLLLGAALWDSLTAAWL